MKTYWIEDKTARVTCLACGDTAIKPLLIGAEHTGRPGNAVEFARCGPCGSLCCTSAAGEFDELQSANETMFLRSYLECTAGPWEMFWPPASVSGSETMSYLDVGCGFGLTVDAWRTLFAQPAFGCDPARYAREGRRLLGTHVHHALLDDVDELTGQRFDIVYASEVIEHVPVPRDFVALLQQRLNPGGVLVLTTPAAEFVDRSNDLATVTAALGAGYHAVLFSAQALQSVLRSAGFAQVVVERHGERLVAWASMRTFDRRPPEQLKPAYLNYLEQAWARPVPADDAIADALRAGHAYRLLKERLFRGELHNLEPLVAQLEDMQFDLLPGRAPGRRELIAAVRAVAPEPLAFGEVARYHLPQAALLFGVYRQLANGDAAQAREWLELCTLSCEKICAASVANNLEAAAFYWIAFSRLVSYDLADGRVDAAAARIARMIASMIEPDAAVGGSAIKRTEFTDLFAGCLEAMRSRRQWPALQQLAAGIRHGANDRSAAVGGAIRFAAELTELWAAAEYDAAAPRKIALALLQRVRSVEGGASDWIAAVLARMLPGIATESPAAGALLAQAAR